MTIDQHYSPATIERDAQKFWTENKTFEVTEDPSKDK
ncbi:MAG: leucyl-tRNA synthetase, partial [Porticoccaceae bacterium]